MTKKIIYIGKTIYTKILLYCIILIFSTSIILHAQEQSSDTQKTVQYSEGTKILVSNVKYSLNYLGLNLCEPLPDQNEYSLVYKISYTKLTEKILLPIQQILAQNNLSVGKLTEFPNNQGFSYRVLYKYKHIGNLIIINESTKNSKKFIPTKTNDINNNITTQPKLKFQPKMSIIIDDFGYSNSQHIQEFLNLDLDITISIIPGHDYSTWISKEAHLKNKEVIIHMPMASNKKNLNLGESQYLLSENTNKNEILNRVEKALVSIPHAVGMNNHMGSEATRQPDIVLPLIKILKNKNLYFVDSLTSPLSIMYENCIVQEVPTGRRRIFLDNIKSKDKIIKQLRRSIKISRRSGSIIVTGHAYTETLEAIKYLMINKEFSDINVCRASKLVY